MSEFQKDSLSLEETNKLRIKLGLKPLTDDGPADSKPAADGDDGAKSARQVDEDAEAERRHIEQIERNRREKEQQEIRDRIAKAQNKRELARKLQGPTLADPEPAEASGPSSSAAPGSQDTLKWLRQAKKRAKENAAKLARELQEQETQAQAVYDESDLAGLKVAHDVDDFDDGDERILTLRDSGVLDDADDELMDYDLDQAERDRINQERKKARRGYTGLDDDQFDEANVGRRRGVLSKYDADIADDGLTRSSEGGFRLGAGATKPSNRKELARRELEQEAAAANKQLLSLDYAKNQEVSDYLQEGDVGFKKPKAKKRKKAARVKLDLDDPEDAAGPSISAPVRAGADADANGDVEMGSEPAAEVRKPRARDVTENFVDDDELQASLAKVRRQKAKRTFVKMTPEMIAKNLAAQRAAEEAERAASGSPYPGDASTSAAVAGVKEEEEPAGGLTFDSTSEFVRTIGHRQAAEQADEDSRRRRLAALKRESISAEPGLASAPSASAATNGVVTIKKEESEDVDFGDPAEEYEAARMAAEGASSGSGADAAATGKAGSPVADPLAGLPPAEPSVSMGVAGTLALLRNQGMLPTISAEEKARERQQQEYDRWLAQRRQEEQLRELERKMSKAQGSAKDQATREYENRKRELDEARSAQDRFKDYKPDVDIQYHDEFGRQLTPHEAWKQLSHVFHGKKPGAKKIEKRLKKIEDEKKRQRASAGDTPSGMLAAFQSRAERTGQAHMVLSVGSRGSAPSDLALLGPNTVSASTSAAAAGGAGKGKKRATSAVSPTLDGSRSTSVTALDDGTMSSATTTGGDGGEQSVATSRRGWAAVGAPSSGAAGSSLKRSFSPAVAPSPGGAPSSSAQPFRINLSSGGGGGGGSTKRKAEDDE
ncbi:uncharacterized protein PFL1_04835 [Pseudozyma flocculosa PF-1]|uniref:Related to SNU66 - component of the U4/U6.U5 snRNP complex n=2 Tax=Pseudozyma flocculosa TaxID=84751 RepID=A0A5C3F5C4_9BASI|nr:uncharacterized protein PFL1_04835 [Pseudozyma flocculosa PF-1]EPQ27697.1 hypothetical protein PFL1_04835 [Pseudozyma flocculosa PF-1]SPO39166.1 related to SNU66 - component of the U4/U6.U5 snRNP complex [Pseudozyma flocculosa]